MQLITNILHMFYHILPAPLAYRLKQTKPAQYLFKLLMRHSEARYLNLSSTHEPEVQALLKRIVRPGQTCVDVGANVGYITLLLARLVDSTGQVIAFEAHPANSAILHQNLSSYKLAAHIKVENMAVSDGSCETVRLFPGRNHASAEWNIVGHDVEGQETKAELEVRAISLDQYFSTGPVDFVKIDVEGAEAQVLAGMKRILRDLRPVVFVEFHDATGWEGRWELYAAGYNLYDLNGHQLKPSAETKRVYHCLALPPDGKA
jgi:FkbM family methyltransferase